MPKPIKQNFTSMDWTDGAGSTSSSLTSNPLKRKILDVSGNNSGPIPNKRLKLEWTSGLSKILGNLSDDTWILKSGEGNDERILTSTEQPKFLGASGLNLIYETTSSFGNKSRVEVYAVGATNWNQKRDIVWINKPE